MKNKRFEDMQKQVSGNFNGEAAKKTAELMKEDYEMLCKDHISPKDPMEHHKRNNIYPVVAAFHALMKMGMEREEAAKLATDSFLILMGKIAGSIRKMMKIPGAYKLMPVMWKKMMPKLFSRESGFAFEFYPTDNSRVKFDMTKCPYLMICRELDCLELAPAFCSSDDICYGHMHDKLIWNRTVTLARNDCPCDFDLYIKK